MTSDIIAIWAGILGLAYLTGAGLYFEIVSVRRATASVATPGRSR